MLEVFKLLVPADMIWGITYLSAFFNPNLNNISPLVAKQMQSSSLGFHG